MKTLYLVKDNFTRKFENLSKFSYLSKNFVIQDLPFNKVQNKLEYFLTNKKKFIYPLYIGSNNIFRQELPTLPVEIINSVKSGKGLVVFFYLNEGNFHTEDQFRVVDNWVRKCNLSKEYVYFFCSNHKIREVYDNYVESGEIQDTVNYYGVTYFESCMWSTKNVKRRTPEKFSQLKKDLIQAANVNNSKNREFYFNCLNRKPRNERVFLTSLIKSSNNTSSLVSLSIGDQSVLEGSYKLDNIPLTSIKDPLDLQNVNRYLKENFQRIKKYGYSLDFQDLGKPGSDKFNPNFYSSSFGSIVVETEHDDRIMFLSEKTFKPILMHHPFFIIGNKDTLKFLKYLGYKTFSNWWDESYDSYDNIYDRIYYAYKEVEKICKLDKKELSCMLKDMHSTLSHNFNHYFSNKRYVEEYNPILKHLLND